MSGGGTPTASATAAALAPEAIKRYVDATAALLSLPLDAAHRPGVLRYFALAAEMATLVGGMTLATVDEPAPAFVPIGPEDLPGAAPLADADADAGERETRP